MFALPCVPSARYSLVFENYEVVAQFYFSYILNWYRYMPYFEPRYKAFKKDSIILFFSFNVKYARFSMYSMNNIFKK